MHALNRFSGEPEKMESNCALARVSSSAYLKVVIAITGAAAFLAGQITETN